MLLELFTICWIVLMSDGSVECFCQDEPLTTGTVIEVVRQSLPAEERYAN